MKTVAYRTAALNVLRRMPRPTAQRIRDKIEQYAADPASLANNVTAMKGQRAIRLRIGDWRVIMEDGEVLDVMEVGPRGGIYG